MPTPRLIRTMALLLATAACAKVTPPPAATPRVVVIAEPETGITTDWKAVALPSDRIWIDSLATEWKIALAEARARRFDKAIADETTLLEASAAQPRPAPPPGRYRCRTYKIGLSERGKGIGFARFKPFFCFIGTEDRLLTLTKATGTQRPGGRLWDDGDARLIFLGGTADGGGPAPYGADPKLNLVGVVERVGDFRWRLVTPPQADDARIEVIELVPDTPPPTEPAQ